MNMLAWGLQQVNPQVLLWTNTPAASEEGMLVCLEQWRSCVGFLPKPIGIAKGICCHANLMQGNFLRLRSGKTGGPRWTILKESPEAMHGRAAQSITGLPPAER